MKTIFRITFLTAIALILSGLPGCKKEFLDINENPNNPEDVDMKFILPSAQADLAYTVGNWLHIVGGLWAQYWTQGPNASQYNEFDAYSYNNTEADRPWRAVYAGTLKDLDALYNKAVAENNPNYQAVALILQAYTLQVITDAWGDVPYTEALQGFEGITTPKYDSQESIYNSLIALIDSGIAKMDQNSETGPHSDDLVYQGDMTLWKKFANTLKLKIYLRQVKVRPQIAADGIATLPTASSEFLESGEDALVHYIDAKFSQNPLYTTGQSLNTTSNIFASETSVDTLLSLGDPRLADFCDTNQNGLYAGIQQGAGKDPDLFPPPVDDGNYSQYNSEQIIAPSVPVRLMSASESKFLQAEASARGLMTGDAKTLYEAGIEDSWLQWTNSSSDTNFATYIAQSSVAYPGSMEDQIKAIITQKWIAMTGNQNFEAWTEWRRTGYPDFFVLSATTTSTEFPARLAYPSDELTSNPNVISGLTIFNKVWWDID